MFVEIIVPCLSVDAGVLLKSAYEQINVIFLKLAVCTDMMYSIVPLVLILCLSKIVSFVHPNSINIQQLCH